MTEVNRTLNGWSHLYMTVLLGDWVQCVFCVCLCAFDNVNQGLNGHMDSFSGFTHHLFDLASFFEIKTKRLAGVLPALECLREEINFWFLTFLTN